MFGKMCAVKDYNFSRDSKFFLQNCGRDGRVAAAQLQEILDGDLEIYRLKNDACLLRSPKFNSKTTQNSSTMLCKTDEIENEVSIHEDSFASIEGMITGNRLRILKSFDLRSNSKTLSAFPARMRSLMKFCIANHPTQQHNVLADSEEVPITVYDLRQRTIPHPISALMILRSPA